MKRLLWCLWFLALTPDMHSSAQWSRWHLEVIDSHQQLLYVADPHPSARSGIMMPQWIGWQCNIEAVSHFNPETRSMFCFWGDDTVALAVSCPGIATMGLGNPQGSLTMTLRCGY